MSGSESFPMAGGDSPYSYAKNSSRQKKGADGAKAMLTTGIIENLDIEQSSPTWKTFRIADLGCSIGPNTFIAMKNIIEAIQDKYQIQGHTSHLPEFQVFFNDHVSNDFNTLFTTLPPDRQYFVTGVPGSFHGRLFPEASLDFVYSSLALQWLSKAPKELGDLNSPLCNKGRIYYANAPIQVGEAYAAQYARDIEAFLDARAQELAPGGLMLLLIPGRPDGTLPVQSSIGALFFPLESTLVDMASEGIVSEAKIDSFNLPMYCPSPEELRKLIQRNGCFDIAKLEQLHQEEFVPLFTAEECRAGMEIIISRHFGSEIIEQLFDRYRKKIAGRPPLSAGDGIGTGLFILLKRNR